MDYGRDGNVVQIITGGGGGGGDSWSGDQADWATEDEYRFWNNGNDGETTPSSNSNCGEGRQRSGSEPPNKKSRNNGSQDGGGGGSSRSKAIGKMFFKTKLCCKFRAGTCPYITNCNFAHSIEELRRPPPNWQEIVAAHEEEKAVLMSEQQQPPREEFQIPTLGSSGFAGDMTQRSYKGRHCKKFYTEEGCPYGDSCTFLHDEQSKNRESVAISLGPGGYAGGGGSSSSGAGAGASAGGGAGGGGSGNGGVAGNGTNSKPSNWKTRICNKWEMTGYCPFGNKCHFAHGATGMKL